MRSRCVAPTGSAANGALPAVAQVTRGLLATARPTPASSTVVDPFGSTGVAGDLGALATRVGDWWAQVQEALNAWPDGSEAEQRTAIATLASAGLQGVAFDTPRRRWRRAPRTVGRRDVAGIVSACGVQ